MGDLDGTRGAGSRSTQGAATEHDERGRPGTTLALGESVPAAFPVPFGWFQVGWSDDLDSGVAKPLSYFDSPLVLWRDDSGVPHLNDAHCPHLGAHLGHGGRVAGSEIVCPFHGWSFDPDGTNTDIPYSARTNRACRLRAYPLVERNGILLAWYHPDAAEPAWEIPEVEGFGDRSYTDPVHREFIVESPLQEMAENGADSAHFGFVHGQVHVPTIDSYVADGPIARMESTQRWPTADGPVDAFVTAESHGPGFSVVRMSGVIETVLIGANTPITGGRCHLHLTFAVKKLDDPAMTSMVGDGFIDLLTDQIGEDVKVWEHKQFVPRPALADEDGPIMKFRSWFAQFYPDEA